MKCWLPLVSTREQCICVSPVLIHKAGAKEMRAKLERIEREEERARRLAEVERVKAESVEEPQEGVLTEVPVAEQIRARNHRPAHRLVLVPAFAPGQVSVHPKRKSH